MAQVCLFLGYGQILVCVWNQSPRLHVYMWVLISDAHIKIDVLCCLIGRSDMEQMCSAVSLVKNNREMFSVVWFVENNRGLICSVVWNQQWADVFCCRKQQWVNCFLSFDWSETTISICVLLFDWSKTAGSCFLSFDWSKTTMRCILFDLVEFMQQATDVFCCWLVENRREQMCCVV
jgi:hypothetical protein